MVPCCSCCLCVDLYCDRDSGTTDYAIELPLFRRSIILRALTWKRRQQPSSRASTLPSGYFPYLLTRITSVPECAVSSVGFLWGSATVSQACGASVGLAEALICPAFPIYGARVPRLPEVTQRHRSGLPAGVDSAPEDRITDRYPVLAVRSAAPPAAKLRCTGSDK